MREVARCARCGFATRDYATNGMGAVAHACPKCGERPTASTALTARPLVDVYTARRMRVDGHLATLPADGWHANMALAETLNVSPAVVSARARLLCRAGVLQTATVVGVSPKGERRSLTFYAHAGVAPLPVCASCRAACLPDGRCERSACRTRRGDARARHGTRDVLIDRVTTALARHDEATVETLCVQTRERVRDVRRALDTLEARGHVTRRALSGVGARALVSYALVTRAAVA